MGTFTRPGAAVGWLMAGILAVLSAGEGLARGADRPPSAARAPGLTTDPPPDVVPGEVVVRYREGTPAGTRRSVRALAGSEHAERSEIAGVEVLSLAPEADLEEAVAALARRPEVRYAEPNFIVRAADPAAPNDPLFGQQWGPPKIQAPGAWTFTQGSPHVVIAVVDTGIQADHPDLIDNVREELGRSWVGSEANVDPHGHGTHVAGIAGGVGDNGVGIAGVAWEAGIASLQVLEEDGFGRVSDVAAAFAHAGETGIPIVNASLSWYSRSRLAEEAMRDHPDTLFVVPSGNDNSNNDREALYPCSHRLPNVLCITATNEHDGKPWFANIGQRSVHLGAPGERVLSTWPPDVEPFEACAIPGYCTLTGTSMAAPHAAGVAALIRSTHPDISVRRLKEAMLRSVDPLASMGATAASGRLNAATALVAAERLMAQDANSTGAFLSAHLGPAPRATFQRTRAFDVRWGGDGSTHDVRYRRARHRGPFGPTRLWLPDTAEANDRFRAAPGFTYCFRARTRDADGVSSPWSAERCTAVPVNDRALQPSGRWTRITGRAGHFERSFSQSRRRGSRLVLPVRGAREVALIVTRCPRCGTLDVLWRGQRLRRVGLRAPSVRKMRFVRLPIRGGGRLVIEVASRGRPVRVEGVAISRA